MTILAMLLLFVASAHASCWWPSDWGCHGHGSWSWGSCSCDANWGGSCCDAILACSSEFPDMCPQSNMVEKSFQCVDVSKDGPIRIGTAPLPPQMRGVFWLAEQGDSSALMSFAQSNDGAGLSQGALAKEPEDSFNYKIRVGGDKVWSFHDRATSWGLVEALDLIYSFRMNDAINPTQATIIPTGKNVGLTLDASWLLDFQMTLFPMGNHSVYKSSWVWGRPSSILGFQGGYYDLVQVIDEKGDKLEPAFSDWVKYCEDGSQTGETPGTLWYREADPVAA